MSRSDINNPTVQLDSDGGAVAKSLIRGEQVPMELTADWITGGLSGYTIEAQVVEGANDGLGNIPDFESENPSIVGLTIRDTDVNDNVFDIIFPANLIEGWTVKPTPGAPVYGFFGVKISDNGLGLNQVIRKPITGVVEVRYSPTEAE